MTDIDARINMMRDGVDPDGPTIASGHDNEVGWREQAELAPTARHTYTNGNGRTLFKPLENAADEYIHWSKTPEERAYTGIRPLDTAMRGIAPGELCMIVGYVHSGKTVLLTQILRENPDQRTILFTPDETRVLVLTKLASLEHKMSAEDMERAIYRGDKDVEDMLRATAREMYPNLAVFDDSMTIDRMNQAVEEVSDHWGDKPQLAIFDYADLLSTGDSENAGDTRYKMGAFKNWTSDSQIPFCLVHQSSRTAGSNGAEVTIDSGGYGGEAQSTFVIGVRRKKMQYLARIRDIEEKLATQSQPSPRLHDMLADARYDLEQHQDTITINLVKNKRPPARLVDDMDWYLDPLTGDVTPLDSGELVSQVIDQQEAF